MGCSENDNVSDNDVAKADENETTNEATNQEEEQGIEEEETDAPQNLELYPNTIDVYEELNTAWDNIESFYVPKELPYPKEELTGSTTFFSSLDLDDMSIHFRHKDYETISIHSTDNEYKMKDDDTELFDTVNDIEFYINDDKLMYTYEDMDYSINIDDFEEDELDEVLTSISDLELLGEKPVTYDFTKYPMPTKLPFEDGQEVSIEIFTVLKPEEFREKDNSHEFKLTFKQSSDIEGSSDAPSLEFKVRDDEPPFFMNADEEHGEIVEYEGKEYHVRAVKDNYVEIMWQEEEAEMYYDAEVKIENPEENMDFVLGLLHSF